MIHIMFNSLLISNVFFQDCFCQQCVLSLHRDLPKKHEPLYFIQNGNNLDLLMPHMVGEDGVMTLYEGQQLVLACPGKNNHLTVTGTEATLSKCVGGIMLNIEDKQFPTYQLECTNPVQANVQITSETCALDKGTELRIGFKSPHESILNEFPLLSFWRLAVYLWRLIRPKRDEVETSRWINLVTICHNMKNSEALYSTHIIYGKTLAGAEMKMTRPQFSQGNEELYPGFNPDHFYKKHHQRRIFTKILGKKQTNKYLQDNFLSRGHLAPDADFLFGTWQYITYCYANSAPQWLSINAGNWQLMERNIRQYAIIKNLDLLVATGTYEILQLLDHNSNYRKIYLHPEENRLPVPKYFWKVLSDPEKKACIAFICSNNPFLLRKPNKLCTNICTVAGWHSFSSLSKGYIYCCDVTELRKTISNIPPIDCTSLLVGTKAFYNYKDQQHPAAT